FQIHADWLLEICQADLSIAVTIHSCPPSARFLPDSCVFRYSYYITNQPQQLALQGFFNYSGYII
ncbi:MAG: hypothetical protein PUE96_01170, partial [Oscillospiraceae bacterium]|nr:hypothetical protein [Oscillospiraceae bacterium]